MKEPSLESTTMLHTEKKKIFSIASLPFPLSERSQTCTQERADIEEKDFVTSKVTLLLVRAS